MQGRPSGRRCRHPLYNRLHSRTHCIHHPRLRAVRSIPTRSLGPRSSSARRICTILQRGRAERSALRCTTASRSPINSPDSRTKDGNYHLVISGDVRLRGIPSDVVQVDGVS